MEAVSIPTWEAGSGRRNDLLNVEETGGGVLVVDGGKPWVFKDEPGGGKIAPPKVGVGCGVGRVLLISAGMTILPLGSCDGATVLLKFPSRAG